MERWLKMGAACKAVGCHRDTMLSWIRAGHVTAKQVPAGKRKDWRILEDSLPIYSNSIENKAQALMERAGL